jgi:hypothetical protein
MERAIQIYALINFTVIGLSHALQPRAWVEFFAAVRNHGKAGVFGFAFVTLIFGSIIVAFHNVWSGLPMVLTIMGWGQVIKALIYFAFPDFGLRQLRIPTNERAYTFVIGGIVLLLFAAVLGYHLLSQ